MLESLSADRFRLQGEMGMRDNSLLLRELLALPKKLQGSTLHLDVGALVFADSLLLAALLDLQRQLQRKNQQLRVSGMREDMLGLARVYGIDDLLNTMMETKS